MRYLIIVFLISSQLLAFEKFLFEENIKFKEGILKIKYDENNNIFMTGPVSEIENIKIDI